MSSSTPLTPNDCFRLGLPFPSGTTAVNAWHTEPGKAPELRTHILGKNIGSSIHQITKK